VVATALARRAAWVGVALVAVGFVGYLALHGERRDAALQRFESEGFLATVDLSSVRRVVVEAGGRQSIYDRSSDGRWSMGNPPQAVASDLAQRLEQAVDLLQRVKPERQFTAEEMTQMPKASLGLEPPVMRVSVATASGAPPFVIVFGTENPLGHARYAWVGDSLWLVPRHMADAWDGMVRQP
jgi:hypothetical protein